MSLVKIHSTNLDRKIAREIAAHTNHRAERAAEVLTWGADEKVLTAAIAVAWLCCRQADPATKRVSDHIFAANALATVLPHLLKGLIDQERPDGKAFARNLRGIPLSGKKYDAFPSGHAVHVGALVSAATLLPARWRNLIWITGGALVATRVVLLAHWASDVVVGLAIGTALERLLRPFTKPTRCSGRKDKHG